MGLLKPNFGFGSIFPIWEITTKTQENPKNFLFFSHFGNHQKFPVFLSGKIITDHYSNCSEKKASEQIK